MNLFHPSIPRLFHAPQKFPAALPRLIAASMLVLPASNIHPSGRDADAADAVLRATSAAEAKSKEFRLILVPRAAETSPSVRAALLDQRRIRWTREFSGTVTKSFVANSGESMLLLSEMPEHSRLPRTDTLLLLDTDGRTRWTKAIERAQASPDGVLEPVLEITLREEKHDVLVTEWRSSGPEIRSTSYFVALRDPYQVSEATPAGVRIDEPASDSFPLEAARRPARVIALTSSEPLPAYFDAARVARDGSGFWTVSLKDRQLYHFDFEGRLTSSKRAAIEEKPKSLAGTWLFECGDSNAMLVETLSIHRDQRSFSMQYAGAPESPAIDAHASENQLCLSPKGDAFAMLLPDAVLLSGFAGAARPTLLMKDAADYWLRRPTDAAFSPESNALLVVSAVDGDRTMLLSTFTSNGAPLRSRRVPLRPIEVSTVLTQNSAVLEIDGRLYSARLDDLRLRRLEWEPEPADRGRVTLIGVSGTTVFATIGQRRIVAFEPP